MNSVLILVYTNTYRELKPVLWHHILKPMNEYQPHTQTNDDNPNTQTNEHKSNIEAMNRNQCVVKHVMCMYINPSISDACNKN